MRSKARMFEWIKLRPHQSAAAFAIHLKLAWGRAMYTHMDGHLVISNLHSDIGHVEAAWIQHHIDAHVRFTDKGAGGWSQSETP